MPEESETPKIIEEKQVKVPDINKEEQEIALRVEKDQIEMQKPEDPGKLIIVEAEAYKTIILYASRYANQYIPSKDWKEIYGILIGRADDDFVYVERAEALTYGHATDVQLDARHYGFIEQIQNEVDKEGKGQYMVGWFHSHPGLNLFFSYIDLLNQLSFQQSNQDFCGLVFDHTLLGKKKEEIIKGKKGKEYTITKFETGFEIYRITDVNMDINDAKYDANYHKVECIMEGLNKFFFANVLSELSALASAGKPLQKAYGEPELVKSPHQNTEKAMEKKDDFPILASDIDTSPDKHTLVEIPINKEVSFGKDGFSHQKPNKKRVEFNKVKESAEKLIFEGNKALNNGDAFTGIEKYREGIEKYKKLKDNDRMLEILRNVSEYCISTNHLVIAEEFSEELYNLSKKLAQKFYKAEGKYLKGYIMLKKGTNENLREGLREIQKATIDYEAAKDNAGAGRAYYKIGTIYQSRLNRPYNSSLFYIQAIKSYKEALNKNHPLRKALWSKSELLIQRITEIKDIVVELISDIKDPKERNKITDDLNSIRIII